MNLTVGQKASRSLTLTADHVETYAELSGDHNPLHFDPDFAAGTKFKRLTVQGGLTTGLVHALVATDLPGPGTVFMNQNWRFPNPVYIGDTIIAEAEVVSIHNRKPVTRLAVTVTRQTGEVVLEGEAWCYTFEPAPPAQKRSITMADGSQVGQQAAIDIENWLWSLSETVSVKNVEGDPPYQARDIDLIWGTQKQTYYVEIKGDRWHKTGNFFFETHSNKEKGTPGCFIYTEANLLFYYFVEPGDLYILPMPQTRDWFLKQVDRFKEKETTTPVGNSRYTTVGRLVPIDTVLAEVPGVRKYQLSVTGSR